MVKQRTIFRNPSAAHEGAPDDHARTSRPRRIRDVTMPGTSPTCPPGADILDLLARQRTSTLRSVRRRPRGPRRPPLCAGQVECRARSWSTLSDMERIMAYRALRVARGDTTPLPGFDENAYAPLVERRGAPAGRAGGGMGRRPPATLSFFRHLAPEAWTRRGTASGAPVRFGRWPGSSRGTNGTTWGRSPSATGSDHVDGGIVIPHSAVRLAVVLSLCVPRSLGPRWPPPPTPHG